jgi:hypothetical protein
MARKHSDPLRQATRQVLEPALEALGFTALGPRTFARMSGRVLQYISLQLSQWGSREFAVNYASIALVSPRDVLVGNPGGRLPRGRSPDGWWPSKTEEFALASVGDVESRIRDHCLPFFGSTASTELLLTVMHREHDALPGPRAHALFDIACCQADVARLAEASATAAHASDAYADFARQVPGGTWCTLGIARCNELRGAIATGGERALLDRWLLHSISHLGLETLC